jgi:hypothetical protein
MTVFRNPGQSPATWVVQAMPGPLGEALGKRGGVPHNVFRLIDQQLQFRSADELRERIERRWFGRFSHLTGRELRERADQIAWDLLVPGDCPAADCEDGWLRDDSGSCPQCRKGGSVLHMTGEDQGVAPVASPRYAGQVLEGMRDQRRRTHGMPRGERSRHVVKHVTDYAPAPYTLREPESDLQTEDQIELAQRAERAREVQRLAEQRAKADRAARARQARRNEGA